MYKYFVKKNNVYVSKPLKYVDLVVGIIVLIGGIWLVSFLPKNNWYFVIAPIFGGIYNIALFGKRLELDGQNKVITISYFGLLKKKYAFERIYNFSTLRHLFYGLFHSGTDISIIVMQNNREMEIQLFSRISNTKKIQIIIEEIKQILV
jgi:hypothetical protein